MQCCLAACCSNSFRKLYTCFILLYCWFFLNYSWWIALNRRHEKTTSDVRCIVSYKQLAEMWVSSIGVDQVFPLDCLNLIACFSVAGCHNLPKRFSWQTAIGRLQSGSETDAKGNTLSIAREIYCTKKINQIRSFLGEQGYYLNIQRATILYWMNPVMAKCHQLLISKLPSLEAHNAWWCSDPKISFCFQRVFFPVFQAESWIRTHFRVVLSCQTSVVHTQVHMKGKVVKSPRIYQGWSVHPELKPTRSLAASKMTCQHASLQIQGFFDALSFQKKIRRLSTPGNQHGCTWFRWNMLEKHCQVGDGNRKRKREEKRRDGLGQISKKMEEGFLILFLLTTLKSP